MAAPFLNICVNRTGIFIFFVILPFVPRVGDTLHNTLTT